MGISAILSVVSLAMGAMATSAQNKALEAQSQAAARQAEGEIREFDRQRDFANKKSAADKSARVREADRDHASMLVGMADMGGEGTTNEARLSSEVGFYEGLDIARLEGNRVRQGESLKSKQVASKNKALNIAAQNKAQAKVNTYKFLSSAATTGASAFSTGPSSTLIGSQSDFDRANYFDGV